MPYIIPPNFDALILQPLPAVEGTTPLQEMPTNTPDQKKAPLMAGGNLPYTNAHRTQERKSWSRHLTGIATNQE